MTYNIANDPEQREAVTTQLAKMIHWQNDVEQRIFDQERPEGDYPTAEASPPTYLELFAANDMVSTAIADIARRTNFDVASITEIVRDAYDRTK